MTTGPRFTPDTLRPTAEQLAIQTAPDKFIVVEANAGAAKTTTLALRMAETAGWGVPPEKVIALTYTAPACDALRAGAQEAGGALRRRPALSHRHVRAVRRQRAQAHRGRAPELLLTPQALRPHVLAALHHVEDNAEERYPDRLLFPAAGDALVEEFLR